MIRLFGRSYIMNYTQRALIITAACLGMLTGCSSHSATVVEPERTQVQVIKAPGVVEYVWEEPMVDVVDVPPGLDPEGTYYRPGHQEVVEIRQGRWRYYRDPRQDQK